MRKKGPIALGIVGLGRAGWGMHYPELKGREERFRIAAVCDRLPERLALAAEACGCRTYTCPEELIADPGVELVDIASRSSDHYAHAALALRAGKAVFLEKPICRTYREARKIQALARRLKGRVFARHNRFFEPAFQHILELIASGILGKVFEVKLRRVGFSRRDDWQTLKEFGGGQLLNWGAHIVQHALRFLEAPVAEQWSDLKCVAAAGDAEDHLKIVLRGTNGRVVDIEISGGAAIGEPEFLIWGNRGALSCTGDAIALKYLDPGRKLAPRKSDAGVPAINAYGTPDELVWIEKTIPVHPSNGWDTTSIWDELYRTIREGKRYPVPLAEAVEVMRVIDRAKQGTRFAS